MGGKGRDINVMLSPFVPKPHTPFERERQMPSDYFYRVVDRVRSGSPRSAKIKNHDVAASILEGVLARGDERLGSVILQVYREGARFDSWKEYFRPSLWFKNLDEIIPAWRDYLGERSPDELLPWSVVSTGFEAVVSAESIRRNLPPVKRTTRGYGEALDTAALDDAMYRFSKRYVVMSRIRMCLTKKGAARFISHLDFAEVVRRALRMASIPVAYTQGFNKHERISYGYPVPLGIESESELCDVELYGNVDSVDLSMLSNCMPDGIAAVSWSVPSDKGSLMAAIKGIEYHITISDQQIYATIEHVIAGLSEKIIHVEDKKRDLPLDHVILRALASAERGFTFLLSAGGEESVRVDTLLRILTGRDDFYNWAVITKIAQYGKSDDWYRLG